MSDINWKKFTLAKETKTAREETINRNRLVELAQHLNYWDAKFFRDTLNEIYGGFEK